MKYCCENCFTNNYLKKYIQEQHKVGICDYCNSESAYIISTRAISFCANAKVNNMIMDDFFEMFIRDHVRADDTIEIISEILCRFFKDRGTQIVLAGYKGEVPYVYKIVAGTKILLNRQDDEIIYGMEVRGLYEKTCEYFEKEIRPQIVFRNLTIEDGIELAKDLIEYAINNEEGCGGDINIFDKGV